MSDIHEIAKSLRLVGLTEVDDAAALLEQQAARIRELSLDLERTRNERNAAHVKARREIHAEYRDRIAELEAEAGEAHTGAQMYQAMLKEARARGFDSVIAAISAAHPPTGDAAGKDSVDAARYRVLRSEECAKSLPHAYAPHDFRPIFGEELDTAIDAIASLTEKDVR